MITDRRRVGRLCLHASRTDDVPTAVRTVREALRLATMPDDGRPGRLFVRRIDLGRIDLRRGAQVVAHLLSEHMRSVRASAVAMASKEAARADVVFARDPIEPLALAIDRVAAGGPLDAWFWARVEPSWVGRHRHEILALAWEELARRPDAPVAMAGVVGALLDAGRIEEACRSLSLEVGRRLWAGSAVWGKAGSVTVPRPEELAGDPIPPRWREPRRR